MSQSKTLEAIALAAQTLHDKLYEVHEDPRYESVWQLYAVHGGKYDGPYYKNELRVLGALLEVLDSSKAPAPGEGE